MGSRHFAKHDIIDLLGKRIKTNLKNYCVTILSNPEKGVENTEKWKNMLAEKAALERKKLLAAA
jgi:hypothetical protein